MQKGRNRLACLFQTKCSVMLKCTRFIFDRGSLQRSRDWARPGPCSSRLKRGYPSPFPISRAPHSPQAKRSYLLKSETPMEQIYTQIKLRVSLRPLVLRSWSA